jgi:molecular chaperone IbpA
MRQFDPAPFYRATVGFDRLLGLLDQLPSSMVEAPTYPPYNIERVGENAFRISMAVAGFARSDLSVEVREGLLHVRGEKPGSDQERQFLHRGIATRSFERQFQLADYVEVRSADLKDGMLNVELVREVPERLKPRSVAIGGGADADVQRLETKAKVAA